MLLRYIFLFMILFVGVFASEIQNYKFNDTKEDQIALAYMFENFESNIEQQETVINGNYKFTINRK